MAASSDWSPREREHLQDLQAELQALKSRWGQSLRLKRATPAEAPATTPFPIAITFSIDPPPVAAHYDVSTLRLQLTLSREALQLPVWAIAAAASGAVATHGSLLQPPPGASLALLSYELPRALRNRINRELCQAWCQALRRNESGAGSSRTGAAGAAAAGAAQPEQQGLYRLSAAASYLQERFVHLITLVPELIEPYQAEDEHGATVRRYAVLNTDTGDEAAGDAAGGGGSGSTPVVSTVAEPAAAAPAADPHRTPPGAGGGQTDVRPATAAGAGTVALGSGAAAVSLPALAPAGPPGTGTAAASTEVLHGRGAGTQGPGVPGLLRPTVSVAAREGIPQQSLVAAAAPRPEALSGRPITAPSPAPPGVPTSAASSAAAGPGTGPGPEPSPSPSPAQAPIRQSSPARQVAPPPPGLLTYDTAQKELQYIQKRHSQVFSARVLRDGPGADGGGGGGGAGVRGSASGSTAAVLVQPGCLTTFELELLPTDPDWDLPAVRLVGQLLPVTEATFLPSLGVHMASRTPPWLRTALEAHMAQQLMAESAAVVAAAEAEAARALAATVAEAEAARAAAAELEGQAPALAAATDSVPTGPRTGAPASTVTGQGPGHPRPERESRGRGGRPGAGGRGPAGPGARGQGGGSGPAAALERPVAPEGTVLLPLGVLRNLFKNLENYAGTIARAADEERRRREAAAAGTAGNASSSSGSDGQYGSDGDVGGLEYDDDGYGDGSQRRDDGTGAPGGSDDGGHGASSGGEGGEGQGGEDEEDAGRDEVGFSGAAAAAGGCSHPDAYDVLLEGLQLDNLATMEVLRANFEVCCARCGTRGSLSLSPSAMDTGAGGGGSQQFAESECPRCTSRWALAMRPRYVHASSNNLCVVKPQGCRPMDLLPSLMAGQCGECNAVMSLRDVQVGLPFTRHCSSCHKELLVSVAAVSFVPRRPPGSRRAAAGGPSTGPRRTRRETPGAGPGGSVVLHPGQPLPALGTCKHYRHSYRWLRFPCCGARFPCDLCHEEAVPDGHAVRWAQRMVCGFCSTEQPVALACKACGRQLAGSSANPSGRTTRFWEGGTGCRDSRRLNKNDPHKWRGRSKTQSAKASRVGPKAWSGK